MKKSILFALILVLGLGFVGCQDLTTAGTTTTTEAAGTEDTMTTTDDTTTTTDTVSTAADTVGPVFTGVEDVTIYLDVDYDPLTGITANDAVDGDVTDDITYAPTGALDTSTEGSNYYIYTVSDAAGNISTAARNIIVEVDPSTIGDEMVQNGDFSIGASLWDFANFNGGAGTFTVVDGAAVIEVTGVSGDIAFPRLNSSPMTIENGVTYEVTFKAKADAVRSIGVQMGELLDGAPYFDDFMQANYQMFDLSTAWQTFSFKMTMNEPTNDNGMILFNTGTVDNGIGTANLFTNVYLDDVMIEVSTPDADVTPPTITGVEDVTIEVGSEFDPLAGVEAIDILDGEITLTSANVTGTVNVDVADDYILTYTVEDAAGNIATETRTVTVVSLVFTETDMVVNGDFEVAFGVPSDSLWS